jgi:hypothetical protein
MKNKRVVKAVARMVLLTLYLQALPAPAWAQQQAPATPAETVRAGALGEVTRIDNEPEPGHPVPALRKWLWSHPGADATIPRDRIPKFGMGDEEYDLEVLRDIYLGLDDRKEEHELVMASLRAINCGQDFEPAVMQEIRDVVSSQSRIRRGHYTRGYTFYGGMGNAKRNIKGGYTAFDRGRPVINFDEPLNSYNIGPLHPTRGCWATQTVEIVNSTFCFNPILDRIEEVVAPYLPPPATTGMPLTDSARRQAESMAPSTAPSGVVKECDKCGKPWWFWPLIGGIGAVAAIALFTPKGGTTNNYEFHEEQQKGTNTPGTNRPSGSTGNGAMGFVLKFGFK